MRKIAPIYGLRFFLPPSYTNKAWPEQFFLAHIFDHDLYVHFDGLIRNFDLSLDDKKRKWWIYSKAWIYSRKRLGTSQFRPVFSEGIRKWDVHTLLWFPLTVKIYLFHRLMLYLCYEVLFLCKSCISLVSFY